MGELPKFVELSMKLCCQKTTQRERTDAKCNLLSKRAHFVTEVMAGVSNKNPFFFLQTRRVGNWGKVNDQTRNPDFVGEDLAGVRNKN